MSTKAHFDKALKSRTISRRFWTLLIVILVLAVTSSALAVRFTATPFLENQQREAIDGQAHKNAREIEAVLEQFQLLLSIVGTAPNVVNVVMGYSDTSDAVLELLEGLQKPQELSWIAVYDVFGQELLALDIRAEDKKQFSEEALSELIAAWEAEDADAGSQVAFQTNNGVQHLVLGAPVNNLGFTEGVILAGFRLNISEMIESEAGNEIFLRSRNTDLQLSKGAAEVDFSQYALTLVLVPDTNDVENAGAALISRSTVSVTIVLAIAFAVFAALGRASLVEPHIALEKQKQSLSELASIARNVNDAIVVTDEKGLVTWVNPAFQALSEYSLEEIKGHKPGSLLQGAETDPVAIQKIRDGIENLKPSKTEILNYSRSGRVYWISISITPLKDEQGEVYGFVSVSSDVTDARKQREAILEAKREIEFQALHDPLTGLPNRRALDEALERRISTDDHTVTLVRIDLDHFKYVNDTLGHAAGDFVLCEVAEILRQETASEDLPVRIGGDEFVVFLAEEATIEDGQEMAERMLVRIGEPKRFGEKAVRVGASFGVASTREGLLPSDQILVGADAALYLAKENGRNTISLYTQDLHNSVLDRRELARELRLAVSREEFVPYFQPQFDAKSHRIVGVETLVRWKSPTLGLLPPGAFLPVAKQLSLIDEIDEFVLNTGISQIKSLETYGLSIPKVSFNVTAERIQNPRLFEALKTRLHTGPKISFEILESVLVEEQSAMFNHSLDRLREMGVEIEIDDFGSGHASIVGLMHLKPDVMKIDQRLVLPVVESDTTRGLLKQIIGMADLLGLHIVAEGVETLEHAQILTQLGCDTLQGFAFCKPMPLEELREFVMRHDAPAAETRTAG